MRKKTKTAPFCYRLRSGKKLCFRLPLNSPSQFLWNHYLAKKGKVKLAMIEIATLARERLNDKHHNETFILSMIAQHKDSVQDAHMRIFELALEQYHKLPAREVLEEPKREETPQPRREETVERKEPIAPQLDKPLEEIEQAFPQNLRDLLSFQIEGTDAILKQKSWLDKEVWTSIMTIVKNLRGRWNRENMSWVIPL